MVLSPLREGSSAPAAVLPRAPGNPIALGMRRYPAHPDRPVGQPSMNRSVDKRRLILDAAVRVFARQGFHQSRVSDIADEAGVAYGLVYHYFGSKDDVLDTLFLERWKLLLAAIAEIDGQPLPARAKLEAIASFIVESYRHEPELMKVIIVEVTRAANTFGQTHLPEIRQAYDLVDEIVSDAQEAGEFRDDVDPSFAAMLFYGAIEQLLSGWIFDLVPGADEDFERAKQQVIETICAGLEPRPAADRVPGCAA